jgi:hypothetical protein
MISRAVLEHIVSPDLAFKGMTDSLKVGGRMIHSIDLRDHRIFSKYGWNPLTFLTIKNSVYHRMTKDAGRPNRKLADFYIHTLKNLGYSIDFYIFDIFGNKNFLPEAKQEVSLGVDYQEDTVNILKEIRPKLLAEYQKSTDDNLMIAGIFIVASKL